jgi:hypothetical protein
LFKELFRYSKNMDNHENADASLIPFLRNLADSIESGKILPRQLQHIGEFFMSYQFQEQAIKDGDTSGMETQSLKRADLMKFIVMGWHIYSCISGESPLPDIDSIE